MERGVIRSKWLILCVIFFAATVAAGIFAVVLRGQTLQTLNANSAVTAGSSLHANEIKAVWIATTSNIDFPSKKGLTVAQQQAELDEIVENVYDMGFNTIFFQVRPDADALYSSEYYPWSDVLTGTQGENPGYDPLAYIIEAAHKKGLKVQAWINPYRIQSTADTSKLSSDSPAKLHPEWTVKGADGGLYFNPGIPEVNELIINGVKEIVEKYDVDGIHLDDYFYPSGNFDDSDAYAKYASSDESLADWRRSNVNSLISGLHTVIKNLDSSVQFGVSPFAVWANKSSNSLGSDTSASCQSYSTQYADTRLWVKNNWLDYICPQIYWTMDYSVASYKNVLSWWADTVKGTNVSLYVGHAVYRVGSSKPGWQDADASEIVSQLEYASQFSVYKGSAFYGYSELAADKYGVTDSIKKYYSDEIDNTSLGNSLTISSPANGLVTDESKIKLSGLADSNFTLLLNGEKVDVGIGGVFSTMLSLVSGKNTFTVAQKMTTKTFSVTYSVNVLRSVSPTDDFTGESGTEISLKAVAHKDATVVAEIGGDKITLAEESDKQGTVTDFATFTGTYTLPETGKKLKSLGKVSFTATWNGLTKTVTGSNIKVAKATESSGEGNWVAVITASPYAETYLYADNLYRPASCAQRTGAWDYVATNSSGGAKKYYYDNETYYKLSDGLYVKATDVTVKKEASPANNQITGVTQTAYDNSRYTRFTFDFSQKITYTCGTDATYTGTNSYGVRNYTVSSFDATTFEITFYNTDSTAATAGTVNSSIISSVDCNSLGGGKVQYVFHLKNKGVFYGVYISYDSNGDLVMDFKNPWGGNLSNLKIAIDAGHGGKDSGALSPNGNSPNEKDLNLTYALKVRDKLIELGVSKDNIFLTRTKDVYIDLDERRDEMVNFRPDISVCIHNNAYDGTSVGTQSYYFQPFSKPLAQAIQSTLISAFKKGKTAKSGKYNYSGMGTDNGASFTNINAYYSCRQLEIPSTLIECGYIDNASEYKWLKSATGTDYITTAIADGIMDYMNSQKQYS